MRAAATSRIFNPNSRTQFSYCAVKLGLRGKAGDLILRFWTSRVWCRSKNSSKHRQKLRYTGAGMVLGLMCFFGSGNVSSAVRLKMPRRAWESTGSKLLR